MATSSSEHRALDRFRSERALQRLAEGGIERLVGLGLVLAGAVLFYGMSVPSLMGPWYCRAVLGVVAAGGILFGMPLLITGRVRQPR